LPGRPFISYHLELARGGQSVAQRHLARLLLRYRLDRVLLLWSVLRGNMSLVGPSARLLSEPAFRQSWTSAWIYARRPGIASPGALLAGVPDGGRAELYDGYYARYGGVRLDLETLLHSTLRWLRGEDPLPASMDELAQPAEEVEASGQKG
jgi:lipopolysaccharide/colanic/teichoic acid biosynthesis glycosyltransferase